MEHGLKDIAFYVKKHITPSTVVINSLLVRDKPLGAPASVKRVFEGIRQYDSSDTGHSDNVNIAAEHQEPAEVLSQLDNTSNSPVYGEYKCC